MLQLCRPHCTPAEPSDDQLVKLHYFVNLHHVRGKQTPARTFLSLPIVLQKKKILPILYQQIEDKAGLIALDELIQGLCQILASSVQFLDQPAGKVWIVEPSQPGLWYNSLLSACTFNLHT